MLLLLLFDARMKFFIRSWSRTCIMSGGVVRLFSRRWQCCCMQKQRLGGTNLSEWEDKYGTEKTPSNAYQKSLTKGMDEKVTKSRLCFKHKLILYFCFYSQIIIMWLLFHIKYRITERHRSVWAMILYLDRTTTDLK